MTEVRASKMNKCTPICKLCFITEEDRFHVLWDCPALHSPRIGPVTELKDYICAEFGVSIWSLLSVSSAQLLQLVIDCSLVKLNSTFVFRPKDISVIEEISRRLCFSIHSYRSFLLAKKDVENSEAMRSSAPKVHLSVL